MSHEQLRKGKKGIKCCCLFGLKVLQQETWNMCGMYSEVRCREKSSVSVGEDVCVWVCVCGKRETATVRATAQLEYIHMSGLVSHNKGWGEAVFMVEGAAANRVAHPGDRSVTWGSPRRRSQTSYQLLFNRYLKPWVKASERFQSISVVKIH